VISPTGKDAVYLDCEQPLLGEAMARTNQRAESCRDCGKWLDPGQGELLWELGQDDGGRFGVEEGWIVLCLDKVACATEQADNRERAKAKAKLQAARKAAKRALHLLGERVKEGEKPPDRGFPKGEKLEVDKDYTGGGGALFFFEPQINPQRIWWILGNLRDGDLWSLNNLGGRAIGWVAPYSESLAGEIRKALSDLEKTSELQEEEDYEFFGYVDSRIVEG
jgi:hypothetical protein